MFLKIIVTDPVLWVREAFLHSEVELMENLADKQGAIGGRLQDGGEQLRKIRLQEARALLNNIRLSLLTVQTCTPTIPKEPGKFRETDIYKPLKKLNAGCIYIYIDLPCLFQFYFTWVQFYIFLFFKDSVYYRAQKPVQILHPSHLP